MPDQRLSNAINQLPRESVPGGGGAWKLLYFMSFVFLVFLLTYVGLTFGYKNFLEARIDTTTKKLGTLVATDPTLGKQDEFLAFQTQLINLKNVLDTHSSPSKILKLLEAHTNARVQYTNLTFSVPDRRVEVQGIAPTYDILAEQLQAFANMKELTRYEMGNARIKEGGAVNFSANLFLNATSLGL